jgi:hypothetical protein
MAKGASGKTARAKKPTTPLTEDGKYPLYEPGASRDAYKKGDVVYFPKVRSWLDKGAFTEAYGRVVSVELFDGEVPYVEVSFDDSSVKKLNKVDLGKDLRRFLLEVK